MVKVGLLLRLEAKPGKEADVASFLINALPLILEEIDTTTWFAVQFGPTTFGIFDAFPHEEGRNAHIAGKVADILRATWSEMLSCPPSIEKHSILAAKLSGQ
ncbi:putative quinol monooxygenase [Geothrix limicola]|uniref:putative quinol monooxygenase n=1 Tax=Geothrix limicola TaxID=2927978 RepID=UPI002554322C|nr:antibiotic biosynthesis monooxygenase [Geothrix limicola]